MKGVLILTGQLRTFYKTIDNIYKNVILPNNFDVFFLIDCDIRGKQVLPDLVLPDCVRGIKYMTVEENNEYLKYLVKILQKPLLINSMRVEGRDFREYLRKSGSILEYYHYMKGMELVEEYENANNIKYDFVMRGRFDMAFAEEFHIMKFFDILSSPLQEKNVDGHPHADDMSCPRDDCQQKCYFLNEEISNLGTIFKRVCEYGNIRRKTNVIFTIRKNVIWCGKRTEMDKMKSMINIYGDYHIGPGRTWDSETQFHQWLFINDICHIDYFSWHEQHVYKKDKNQKFLTDPENALFALIRVDNYLFD
jgi:hypothetical protein